MKKNILIMILFYCFSVLPLTSFAASIPEGVREGNRLYDEKKYGEAVKKYSEAKAESPDSDIVHFNLGAALYKNGSYGEAVDSFTKALNTDDHEIEAKAIYNIANAKYKLGSQNADTDINSAVSLYRESLEYYKRAMDLDESAEDARYNHELVERELKALLEKQQNQPQDQDQNDRDGQKEEQQGKDLPKKDAGDRQESQDRPESSKEDQAEQQEEESAGKSSDQEQEEDKSLAQDSAPQQEGSSEEGTEKMSPEEARMLLESYREDEARDNETKRGRGYYPGVVKNW